MEPESDDDHGGEDEDERPPDHGEVVARAICLAAIIHRSLGENLLQAGEIDAESVKSRVAVLRAWLERDRLVDALSRDEREAWDQGAGQWSKRLVVNATWRTECLGVLAWALGLIATLPTNDVQFDPDLLDELVALETSPKTLLSRTKLRSRDDIEDAREDAELWRWRAVSERILREEEATRSGSGKPSTLEDRVRAAVRQVGAELPGAIDGDFPACGKAFAALEPDERRLVSSITLERLYALNWLCGFSDDWDSVPTDT